MLLAVGTTALLHLRVRWIAALAWIALAVVLAIGGSLARTESERPPASLSTNSDLPSLMFLVLWIVCWTAAFLAATAGTALALFPLDRQQAEQQVTAERG